MRSYVIPGNKATKASASLLVSETSVLPNCCEQFFSEGTLIIGSSIEVCAARQQVDVKYFFALYPPELYGPREVPAPGLEPGTSSSEGK